MSLELLLIRQGQCLAAADPISLEALESLREKETVTASIRRNRNPAHHRKLWALIAAVFPSQSQYATQQDLLNALKVATGYFETGVTLDKIPFMIPKSISFASMSQTPFEQWYDRVVDVILTRILPNVNRDELADQVNDILEGRHATA
jgi:Protein of unknown function (DUF1367)